VNALVRHYSAEDVGRQVSPPHLAERPARVFAAVKEMCEWRLGRERLAGSTDPPSYLIPIADLVECLRYIRNSVRFWSREAGRRGYLGFIDQFIL